MAAVVDRLRRRDPGYQVVRRAVRLTLVASLVFYGCRYGVGNVVLATYALFGTVATGAFARLPGRPVERARTLLAALPVAWLLVAVGTVLAVRTWAAAVGMLVVGFAAAFAGVGGPRLVGLAGAFQLFYILACFPPYQPGTLPQRLAGVTVGILLVALAEVVLWPGPAPVTFPQRLAEAARSVAAFVDGIADVLAGRPGAGEAVPGCHARAVQAVEQTRMQALPVTQRPTSASRRDRALRDAAAALRQLLRTAEPLVAGATTGAVRDADTARLLRVAAAAVRRCGGEVRGQASEDLDVAAAQPAWRQATAGDLRRYAIGQTLVDHVEVFTTAARIAGGCALRPDAGRFWYAGRPAASLYWRQLRAHLTPRSVYFQGALRLAVALAAARVIAGTFELMHGFWALLATLTLMRTSAAQTRTTLGPAVVGTLAGAAGGALLLLASPGHGAYAAVLPLALLLAFGVGPLLGLAWTQAFLTLLLIVVFAQLTPTDWQLAGIRLVDVLIGAAVGVLAGLLMWPRGGGGELRRDAAAYLAAGARVVEETVGALAGRAHDRRAVEAARRAGVLADASFIRYQSERQEPRMSHVNWESALAVGHRVVDGAEALLARHRPGVLAPWPDLSAELIGWAQRLGSSYRELARQLPAGRVDRPVVAAAPAADVVEQVRRLVAAGESRPEVLRPVEVDVWLADLAGGVDRIQAPPKEPKHG